MKQLFFSHQICVSLNIECHPCTMYVKGKTRDSFCLLPSFCPDFSQLQMYEDEVSGLQQLCLWL